MTLLTDSGMQLHQARRGTAHSHQLHVTQSPTTCRHITPMYSVHVKCHYAPKHSHTETFDLALKPHSMTGASMRHACWGLSTPPILFLFHSKRTSVSRILQAAACTHHPSLPSLHQHRPASRGCSAMGPARAQLII